MSCSGLSIIPTPYSLASKPGTRPRISRWMTARNAQIRCFSWYTQTFERMSSCGAAQMSKCSAKPASEMEWSRSRIANNIYACSYGVYKSACGGDLESLFCCFISSKALLASLWMAESLTSGFLATGGAISPRIKTATNPSAWAKQARVLAFCTTAMTKASEHAIACTPTGTIAIWPRLCGPPAASPRISD
jgi:hypothetical protein